MAAGENKSEPEGRKKREKETADAAGQIGVLSSCCCHISKIPQRCDVTLTWFERQSHLRGGKVGAGKDKTLSLFTGLKLHLFALFF